MISVIIPIYNVEKYLVQCIESVLKQTYTQIEVILVNDGSTDHCPEICEKYAKLDERIVYISKQNGGLSDARNAGIEKARGEYLFFLDSDDYLHPEILERLFHGLMELDADISIANYECVTEDITPGEMEEESFEKITGKEGCRRIFTSKGVLMTVAWGKLYRRKLFQEVRYPKGKIHEDEFVTYRLLYDSANVAVTNEKLIYYRQRKDSIMDQRIYHPGRMSVVEAGLEAIRFYENKGEKELQVLAVERELGLCRMLIEEFQRIANLASAKKTLHAYRYVWWKYGRKCKYGIGTYLVNAAYSCSPQAAEIMEKVLRRK
ncbi:MAG: glycosyltransferase family 2 protein [Clostridiales bacterium]|nr:glycosyltransferase family 2 protein [Clostridiales bacterium]